MVHKSTSLMHTKWLYKYHIAFTPKYRRRIADNHSKKQPLLNLDSRFLRLPKCFCCYDDSG